MKEELDHLKVIIDAYGFTWRWQEEDGIERFVVLKNIEMKEEVDSRFLHESEEREHIEYELLRALYHKIKREIEESEIFLRELLKNAQCGGQTPH